MNVKMSVCVCVIVCLRVFVYQRLLYRYVSNGDIFSECSVTFRQPNEEGGFRNYLTVCLLQGLKKLRPYYNKPKMTKGVY